MSNLRTEQPVFETDRITDVDYFFLGYLIDASSLLPHTAYCHRDYVYYRRRGRCYDESADGHFKTRRCFSDRFKLPHSTKSVHEIMQY